MLGLVKLWKMCTVCVLCVYCVCTVCVLCVYCVFSVCVLCVYCVCVCTVCVLCVYCVCTVCVLCVYCVCTVCVLCVRGCCVCMYCVWSPESLAVIRHTTVSAITYRDAGGVSSEAVRLTKGLYRVQRGGRYYRHLRERKVTYFLQVISSVLYFLEII